VHQILETYFLLTSWYLKELGGLGDDDNALGLHFEVNRFRLITVLTETGHRFLPLSRDLLVLLNQAKVWLTSLSSTYFFIIRNYLKGVE